MSQLLDQAVEEARKLSEPSKMPSRLSSWKRLRTTGGGRSRWLARPANWRPSRPEPRNRCRQATAGQRGLNGAFLTPKELRPTAQGCPRQRATLGQRICVGHLP